MNCQYHPIYRNCVTCGYGMKRDTVRVCEPAVDTVQFARREERVKVLREARELIRRHAVSTWNGGLLERSDGITDVLADFDLKFPEVLP